MVKNLPANAGDMGSIPGLEISSKEGNDNPFQYSFFFSILVFLSGKSHGQRSLEGYSP